MWHCPRWNMQWPMIVSPGRQHMFFQNLFVCFSCNSAITLAMGTKTPPYHHRCWLRIWMILFLFSLKDTTPVISPKNIWNMEFVRPLCIIPSYMSSGHRRILVVPGCCYCVYFSLFRCSNKLPLLSLTILKSFSNLWIKILCRNVSKFFESFMVFSATGGEMPEVLS